jgi:predicted nucleotide-binding protein (sugar kinase/HSP70/actin superfamily)
MKLIHQIKHKIYNDISHQLDQKETREKIFNILIIPIIKFLKTDITQKYLNNIDYSSNDDFSNLIIDNINDYFYKELYPFFMFSFIMIILLFILILIVIIFVLKLNIKSK